MCCAVLRVLPVGGAGRAAKLIEVSAREVGVGESFDASGACCTSIRSRSGRVAFCSRRLVVGLHHDRTVCAGESVVGAKAVAGFNGNGGS